MRIWFQMVCSDCGEETGPHPQEMTALQNAYSHMTRKQIDRGEHHNPMIIKTEVSFRPVRVRHEKDNVS